MNYKKEAVTEDLGAEHSRQRTASAKASSELDAAKRTKEASVAERSQGRGELWKGRQETQPRTRS